MRKIAIAIVATIIAMVLCLALSGCSPTCKVFGCSNRPFEAFGSRLSDYCVIHADEYE